MTSSAFVFRAPRFCGRDVCMAVHGAAAPAHQYASRFLRAARPIARPGAGEHARAARGPVAPRAQRLFVMLRGLLGGLFSSFFKTGSTKIYGDFEGADFEGAGWSYFFSCAF